jgi:hypothetical protein
VIRPVVAPVALQREVGMQLRRLWQEGAISAGRVIVVGGRHFRVRGFNPVSVRPRCLYVEELGTDTWLSFEMEEGAR